MRTPSLHWGILALCARALPASPNKPGLAMRSGDGNQFPCLNGEPETDQHHAYARGSKRSSHTLEGEGVHSATTGELATFTIHLVGENGSQPEVPGLWNRDPRRFIYVWIANSDQMMAAEVVNNGDGTLTASYSSDIPGEYLLYIEDIDTIQARKKVSNVSPVIGSPFNLTISGPSLLDIDSLPLCGTEHEEGTPETTWRMGTWISSNIASARHGVMRDGWVFQPKDCIYETFSYAELMALAYGEKPTWLLVVGTSVQRGIFLTLVDMMLERDQKGKLSHSIYEKCWGWSDLRLGNLRISYQDLRFVVVSTEDRRLVCHDAKVMLKDSSQYFRDAKDFFRKQVFPKNRSWPDVIVAPSFHLGFPEREIVDVEVIIRELHPKWRGQLVFLEHAAGLHYLFDLKNPTRRNVKDVGPYLTFEEGFSMEFYQQQLEEYRHLDPTRVSFMDMIPMYRAILFENEFRSDGSRVCYGCSVHYHWVMESAETPSSCNGQRLVRSMMTEMVANILVGKVVGTKHNLSFWQGGGISRMSKKFEVCSDCPTHLFPYAIKPVPDAVCENVTTLLVDSGKHGASAELHCPDWCMKTEPTSRFQTSSDFVSVRECKLPS